MAKMYFKIMALTKTLNILNKFTINMTDFKMWSLGENLILMKFGLLDRKDDSSYDNFRAGSIHPDLEV